LFNRIIEKNFNSNSNSNSNSNAAGDGDRDGAAIGTLEIISLFG